MYEPETKPWTIGVTVRGFYDDNINSWANDSVLPPGYDRSSIGYEISPSILLDWKLDQTTIALGYTYSYKYFENKPVFNTDHVDQSHNFTASLAHNFNERTSLSVHDSFVIGQEPDLLRAGNTFSTFQRVSGDNIRNYGSIALDGKITPLIGYEVGYANAFYHYQDEDSLVDAGGNLIAASTGALMNRMEHNIHLDSRWQLQPDTVGVLGYNFREADYLADQPIGVTSDGLLMSDARNSRSHVIYAGADHTFRPDLTGSLRAGAQFVDYYNDPTADTDVSPYVQASLRYIYMPESYFEAGVTYDHSATDIVGTDPTQRGFTTDAESFVVWVNLKHRITANLYANLNGQYQNSKFQNGIYDSEKENFYLAGVNLEYRFTRNFSAHAGYNYDNLDSDINGRSFDRNRVYIGATASY